MQQEEYSSSNCHMRGDVIRMSKDYQRASKDFDKGNFFEPNNAFILRSHGDVKSMLEDYEGALEDLDKADVIEPNNAFKCKGNILLDKDYTPKLTHFGLAKILNGTDESVG